MTEATECNWVDALVKARRVYVVVAGTERTLRVPKGTALQALMASLHRERGGHGWWRTDGADLHLDARENAYGVRRIWGDDE